MKTAAAASRTDTMDIMVNGAPMPLPAGASVRILVAQCGLRARRIAVERNGAIVPRSLWASTVLAAGDVLEIVHFVGGG